MAHAAGIILLGLLLPLWLAFGVADWWRHRTSFIESTTGWRESAWHLVMIGEASIAVLTAMFFEINALILGICILAFLAHEISTNLDVGYAAQRRLITAGEQRVHGYLTAIPVAVLLIICVTHPGQLMALFGAGGETADFTLRWKAQPLPTPYLVTWLVLSPINGLLYVEEFLRCLRRQKTVTGSRFA